MQAPAATAGASRDAMAQGLRSLGAGDVSTARVEMMNAIKENPQDGLARAVQGSILIALNDGATAQVHLERALALGIAPERISHLLAHAAFLQGNYTQALERADAARISPPFAAYAARVRARTRIAQGNLEAAGQEFDVAFAINPKSSILWSDIGRFRLFSGNLSTAIDAASESVRLDPRNIEGLILTGELMRSQYGLVAAIPWFERALGVDPNNIRAMTELAATLGDAGRHQDMLALTRRILSLDNGNANAFYLQAVVAARANKPGLARTLLYKTGERLDGVPAVILLRAILDIQSGADEQAVIRLRPLVDMQPGNLKARRLLGSAMWRSGDHAGTVDILWPIVIRNDADSYSLFVIGRAFEALDNRVEAARFLDRAARSGRGEPTPFAVAGQLSELAANRSSQPDSATVAVPFLSGLVSAGQSANALDEAVRLARMNPGAPAAQVVVGDIYAVMGRHRDAALAYQQAANLKFSENTALRLVRAWQKAGNPEAAFRALNLFLGQNPRSVPAAILAGNYFIQTRQWNRAIATLEGLRTRIGNRDALILNNLAWCYINTGKPTLARLYAREAYALTPTNPVVVNTYGWSLFKSGSEPATGIGLLEKSTAIAPQNPDFRFRLAQAYASSGRIAEAKRAIGLALSSPAFRDRKTAIALLATL